MKVTQQLPPNTQSIEPSRSPENKGPAQSKSSISPTSAAAGSSVEISDNARLMKQAADIARKAPDMRADKVASLKQSIAAGTYKIPNDTLADRILDEHLNTDFGKNNL